MRKNFSKAKDFSFLFIVTLLISVIFVTGAGCECVDDGSKPDEYFYLNQKDSYLGIDHTLRGKIVKSPLHTNGDEHDDEDKQECTVPQQHKFESDEFPVANGDDDDLSVGFLGVRFAEAPLKEKRFVQSEVATDFTTTSKLLTNNEQLIDATQLGPICKQMEVMDSGNPQSEDCLHLNIYVPYKFAASTLSSSDNDEQLNVMVFIHGGGFFMGHNRESYIDSTAFNLKNTILVAINYRLNVFGFLAHNTVQPNLGLLDQITALRWVKTNIHLFGGNPNSVTVFGESAGAWSIATLLSSKFMVEDNEQLFQRAIMQSHLPSLNAQSCEEYKENGNLYVAELGCDTAPNVLECLQNLRADTILEPLTKKDLFRDFFFHASKRPASNILGHCIDENFPYTLLNAAKSGHWAKEVEVIIGTTKNEGTLFTFFGYPVVALDKPHFEKMLTSVFDHDKNTQRTWKQYKHNHKDEQATLLSDKVKALYYKVEEPSKEVDYIAVAGEIVTDVYFYCATRQSAYLLAQNSNNVYHYVFSHIPQSGASHLGAFHASELPFVFQTTADGGIFLERFTEDELALSEDIQHYFTAFAASGNPNNNQSSSRPFWHHHTPQNRETLLLQQPFKLVNDYKQDICSFWLEIYENSETVVFNPPDDMNSMESYKSKIINTKLFVVVKNWKHILGFIVLVSFLIIIKIVKCCRSSSSKKKKKSSKKNNSKPKKD